MNRWLSFKGVFMCVALCICVCVIHYWMETKMSQTLTTSPTSKKMVPQFSPNNKFNEYLEPPVKQNLSMLKPPSALLKVPTNYDLKLDDNLTLSQIKETMVKYLHTITYKCQNDTRFGKSGDGGWNICMDVGILPNNCIVYSFGINNDWSFDDAIANYGCNVYAFDPTIGLENHKHSERVWFYNIGLYGDNVNNLKLHGSHWKARTLSSIREMLHHGNKIIDVLKFDIEGGEYLILHQVIESGILSDIKVVAFELHFSYIMTSNDKDLVLSFYRGLKMAFEQNGFKLWKWHENESMARKHPDLPFCWVEFYWVNMKFIEKKN